MFTMLLFSRPRRSTTVRTLPIPLPPGSSARAVEFAQHADNPASAADLQQIAIESGIDWRSLLGNGIEDEDD